RPPERNRQGPAARRAEVGIPGPRLLRRLAPGALAERGAREVHRPAPLQAGALAAVRAPLPCRDGEAAGGAARRAPRGPLAHRRLLGRLLLRGREPVPSLAAARAPARAGRRDQAAAAARHRSEAPVASSRAATARMRSARDTSRKIRRATKIPSSTAGTTKSAVHHTAGSSSRPVTRNAVTRSEMLVMVAKPMVARNCSLLRPRWER